MKKMLMAVIAMMMTISTSAQFYIYFSNGTVAKVDSISMVAPKIDGIGVFSVSANKQVTFSKGNLQYHPANDEWRFAENQTDYIGAANANISATYDDWLDLFGWGTGANPTNSSTNGNDYQTFVDWGTNQIGNDAPNTWRTLTYDEWDYLLNNRPNASSLYGIAQVNGVNGLIFLPDDWAAPAGITFKSGVYNEWGNEFYAAYQTFTDEQWSLLEATGAVFLPAAGDRDGASVLDMQELGGYWSATQYDSSTAYCFTFSSNGVVVVKPYIEYGPSVRLVRDIEEGTATPEDPNENPNENPEEELEDNPQNPNCNQAVIVKGDVKEWYEKKEWLDSSDQDLGYYAIAKTRSAATLVKLVVTFTNSDFADEKVIYNITTDTEGKYKLNAKLYDAWDIDKTTVEVEAKSYVSSLIHYYEKWSEDDTEWKQNSQEISGYFKGVSVRGALSEDALLIGEAISDILLTFVPDRYENTIRGIEYYNSYTGMYYDYPVGGVDTFRSWNPLDW